MSTWLEFDSHGKKHYYRYNRNHDAVRATQKQYTDAIAAGIAQHKKNGKRHLPTKWVVGTNDGSGGLAVAQFRSTKDGKHMQLTGTNVDSHNTMVVNRLSRVVSQHLGRHAQIAVNTPLPSSHTAQIAVIHQSTILSGAIVVAVPGKRAPRVLGPEDGTTSVPIVLHMRGSIVPVLAGAGASRIKTKTWQKSVWDTSVNSANKMWGSGPGTSNMYRACESSDVNCHYALTRVENPQFQAANYKAVHTAADRLRPYMPSLETSWQADGASYFLFDAKLTKEAPTDNSLYDTQDKAKTLLRQLNSLVTTAEKNFVALTIKADPVTMSNFLVTRKDEQSPYQIKWWSTSDMAVFVNENDAAPTTPGLVLSTPNMTWQAAQANMKTAFSDLLGKVTTATTT